MEHLDFRREYIYIHQILDFVENDMLLREYVHTKIQCQYDIPSAVESCMLSNQTYNIPLGDETSFIYQLLTYFRIAYQRNRQQLLKALYMYGNRENDTILKEEAGQDKLFQQAVMQFNERVISLFLRDLELYLKKLIIEHEREDQSLSIQISGGTFGDGTIIGSRDFQNLVIKRSGARTEIDLEKFQELASGIIRQVRSKAEWDPLLREEVEELIHTVREQAEQDRPKRIIANILEEKLKALQELEPETSLAGDILDFRELLSRLTEE